MVIEVEASIVVVASTEEDVAVEEVDLAEEEVAEEASTDMIKALQKALSVSYINSGWIF